jgi:hypothetical protein
LQDASSYDAAHIFVCRAKAHPERGLPKPALGTVFEIVIAGKVFRVEGKGR